MSPASFKRRSGFLSYFSQSLVASKVGLPPRHVPEPEGERLQQPTDVRLPVRTGPPDHSRSKKQHSPAREREAGELEQPPPAAPIPSRCLPGWPQQLGFQTKEEQAPEPLAQEPAEFPHADPERERAELLDQVHAKLTEGIRRYYERPVGRISSHSQDTRYSTLARLMMEQEQDLGLSANEDVQSLRESLNAQHEKRTLYLRAFMTRRSRTGWITELIRIGIFPCSPSFELSALRIDRRKTIWWRIKSGESENKEWDDCLS